MGKNEKIDGIIEKALQDIKGELFQWRFSTEGKLTEPSSSEAIEENMKNMLLYQEEILVALSEKLLAIVREICKDDE